MEIVDVNHKGRRVQVYGKHLMDLPTNPLVKFDVFVDGKQSQNNLSAEATIRYLGNMMHSESS